MDYEIEFHPVGDASKAGDAISIRYGANGIYRIIVIDGGTADSGAALVNHIKRHYGANAIIEHAISSHPDTDHASGLREVVKAFRVQHLWLHGLWHHAGDLLPFYVDSRLTAAGLADKLRKEYSIIAELIDLAHKQSIPIHEPFSGAQIGPFTVLSPSLDAYHRLVPQFRKGPAPNEALLRQQGWLLGQRQSPGTAVRTLFGSLIEKVSNWVDETWDVELLKEGAVTAAENETSTVLYGKFGTESVLLTADAGAWGLTWACNFAEQNNIDLSSVTLVQVPHHGSRSNVTPSILNRLLGPKLPTNAPPKRIAIVSAPKDDETHPRKMVINAFRRRGTPVYRTQGVYFRNHRGAMPVRVDEIPATAFDWFTSVEAYD